jgi:hypothetical protein
MLTLASSSNHRNPLSGEPFIDFPSNYARTRLAVRFAGYNVCSGRLVAAPPPVGEDPPNFHSREILEKDEVD